MRSDRRTYLTSDASVLLLGEIECRLGLAERLARCIADPRDPAAVKLTIAEMIRFCALLIAAGYPDGNDCNALRRDPASKMAVSRRPESGLDLCSQPTMSQLENLPGPLALSRMMAAMVDLFCDSFATVAARQVEEQLATLGLGAPPGQHAALPEVQLRLARIPVKPSRKRSL